MNGFSDSGVHDKLISLERDFFASLTEGSEDLRSFLDSWKGFYESLASIELPSHTLGLVSTFATAVRDISTGIVELHRSSDDVADKLATDITEILNNNTVQPSTSSKPSAPTSYPAYIEPSYKWLLENLHNPYPSKETRIAISTQTGCPRRYIDNWFIDARKRIGWNTLRRTYFSNKRTEVIDAATRFFVKDDPDRPLPIVIEMELANMQARAQDINRRIENPSTVVESVIQCTSGQDQGAISYPSPEPSPGPLLRTSLLPTTGDPVPIVEVSVRKRRNSAISLSDSAGLPSKRPRLCMDRDLPSPVMIQPPSSNKRKRGLSDGDCHGFPKRVCNDISLGPRLHTVSDPTPLDGWFRDFFEPVSVDAPDSSTLLDIDIYDCTRFDLQKQSPVDLDSSSPFDLNTFSSPFDIFSADSENNSSSNLLSLGDDLCDFSHSSVNLLETIPSSPLFMSSRKTSLSDRSHIPVSPQSLITM